MRCTITTARVALLTAALAIGCGDDEPVGSAGSIQLTVEPAALSIPQGSSGLVTATLTRIGGFNGSVMLAVTGLPAGVTAVSTPTVLTGSTTTAAVDLSVAASVALGVYTATITATAQGVDQAAATFQVTVTEQPDFLLTVDPSELTVVAGTSGGSSVTIARTGFTGEVILALANPPAGITAVFDRTPTSGGSSAFTLSVAASVPAGAYQVTITGTAAGLGVRNATLALTVPAPPPAGQVKYLFCGVASAPAFFAYQDGNGPWQPVAGSTSGGATSFSFTLAQGFGGVLMVHSHPDPLVARIPPLSVSASRFAARVHEYQTDLRFASSAELAQDGLDACAGSQPTRSVRANVVGVAAGSYGTVSLGGVTTVYDGGTSSNPVLFDGVPAGPVDVIGSLTVPGSAPSRLLIMRNLAVADNETLPAPIDYAGPASLIPVTATVTISGGEGEDLEVYTELVTAKGAGLYWSDLSPGPLSTRPWAGFPPGSLGPGELHGITVFATPDDGSGDFRASVKYVGPVADQNLVMGGFLDAPVTAAVAAGAYPRFRFQGSLQPEYDKGAEIYLVSAEGSGNFYSIIASSAWLTALGNGLAYDITMPDVAGLAGFPLASRLKAGTNAVSAGGFGFTGAGAFDQRPVLGSEFRAAARNTTIDVP